MTGIKEFNPNDLGRPNGNYFGLPYEPDDANLVFVPVPWDVTTSYRPGTHQGPAAMLDASLQIDLYDADFPTAWKAGYSSLPIDNTILKSNKTHRVKAENVIQHLENEADLNDKKYLTALESVNKACATMNDSVFKKTLDLISKNKIVGLIGGDHSVPLGFLRALSEKYKSFGILHFDAHADLREAYEGFEYSHASIMFNAIKIPNVSRLVQVGIRDFCEDEAALINSDKRIKTFTNQKISEFLFSGKSWQEISKNLIKTLPENVYISFDIDALDPKLCPNTGTPVPGGLEYNQAVHLIKTLYKSGRKIIGFDICEVSPGKDDEWDANVGARLLYKLANFAYLSNSRKNK